ncbi:DNA polymerase III subunit gamma/tau [Patescibacteria group bacterium]|nr:DNA polymerase III subunit gamma/tau [Patescibacteria group bacterium]MCG2695036.1 DNA polymerase III subunit gamma/tau [Candidatus Parcubacteria bacterium]
MDKKFSENNTVLYRKYRPQNFKEVLGQDHIIKALGGAINLGNISHAYLFAGTRGTGKTSIARILAKEIGCTDNDLYEIDAASNRGIDDIRELRDSVNVLPLESSYKVYIIDEVHMLTKEAFNALLKTLEEPPKHVVFVLATTELEKLPDTIVSRCQTFSFNKPAQNVLKEMVLNVAKKEGFKLEQASADLIAVLGDGSFRDTHGILQKVISSSADNKISIEEVEMITGAPKGELVNDFISSIADSDLDKGLTAVNKAVENNVDMKIFAKLVLHKLRAVLLLRFAKDMNKIIQSEFSENDFKFIDELANKKEFKISSNTIKEMLFAYEQIGKAYINQLPLELVLIKLISE